MSKQRTTRRLLALLLIALLATACGGSATDTAVPEATAVPAETQAAAATAGPDAPQPIEVTYFTPSQQEGPYYPVEKPADQDNDLVQVAGASGAPAGDVLALSGVVYDATGMPVEDAVVEIWQTDSSGVYDHPGDPGTADRDRNFQFYGESATGPDGVYSFRTIVPGRYEPRPRHIHVKVRRDGVELLTTQFYFGNEINLSGAEANLLIDMAQAEDDAGNPIWVGTRDIVLNVDVAETAAPSG